MMEVFKQFDDYRVASYANLGGIFNSLGLSATAPIKVVKKKRLVGSTYAALVASCFAIAGASAGQVKKEMPSVINLQMRSDGLEFVVDSFSTASAQRSSFHGGEFSINAANEPKVELSAVSNDSSTTEISLGDSVDVSEAKPTLSQFSENQSLQLGNLAAKFLGDQGILRVNKFSKYPNGWDGASSKSLRSQSMYEFNELITANPWLSNLRDVGVFMNSDGSLVINWMLGGKLTELEFSLDGILYFSESRDVEGVLKADDLAFIKAEMVGGLVSA